MNNKDFQTDLLNRINSVDGLSLKASLGYFEDDKDCLVLNSIPGGHVNTVYMDGTREVTLPFEVACKCKSNQLAIDTMWAITDALSAYDLEWVDGKSYNFVNIIVNRPALNGRDQQGYFVHNLQLSAVIEIGG